MVGTLIKQPNEKYCIIDYLKSKIYSSKLNFKKRIKQYKNYREFINHFKKNNIPITKELKETVMNCCRQGGCYEAKRVKKR